ncbi:MAG: tryptophan--tRNA ligase [Christensenellaceae bacterium]|nr:tryptophan--tRNA ligase [Christensenellaceae bacterium]
MKKIILTGDRPTGNLHLGHFVGSLKNRIELSKDENNQVFVMIADLQALTDNAHNAVKVKNHVEEVMIDYLSAGLDPEKIVFFLQSRIPALFELPMFYSNIVSQSRLERNPTVKAEMTQKGYGRDVPVGFVNYPISQAGDITAFGANLVPVGADQAPLIEQTREIVQSFNRIYGEVLTLPEAVIPKGDGARLVGTDGGAKMSKSLGNCIYLKDDEKTLHDKVFNMYTDPNHIHVEDKGQVKGNVVFTYLDIFSSPADFAEFLPEYKNLDELKAHYKRGGLGDVKIKNFLFKILNKLLAPMREKRAFYEKNINLVREYLKKGTATANKVAGETLEKVRRAIGLYEL